LRAIRFNSKPEAYQTRKEAEVRGQMSDVRGDEEFGVQDSGFRRRVLLLLIMILIDLGSFKL
jgi:hypothetical protein